MQLLENRVAFVTGAGSGIGRAIAQAFACEGAAVAVSDLNEDAANRVADEIKAAGGKGLALPLDVSQPACVTAAVAATVATLGGLDILINNAGICPLTPLEAISLEEWNHVLAVNLTGAFLRSRSRCDTARLYGWGRGGGSVAARMSSGA